MMNRKIAVSVALALGASVAGAAHAASPFEGPYVGAQVGYSVYDTKLSGTSGGSSGTLDGLSGRGADGGLYAGWGMLLSPTWYGGLEGEYNWSGAEHTTTATGLGSFGYKDKDNFGLSARLGWLPSSNVMLYGRAGWQRVNVDYTETGAPTVSHDHDGFRLGIGTELAMTTNWAARMEYNHTWYGKDTIAPGVESEPNNDLFRVGVAYHF